MQKIYDEKGFFFADVGDFCSNFWTFEIYLLEPQR